MLYVESNSNEVQNSSSFLLEMMYGYQKSQAIFVATKLGIADCLKQGPLTADELGKKTGVNPSRMYQLMRMLVSIGVFAMESQDRFCLNEVGRHLLANTADSLRGTVLMMGDELYQVWQNLLYGIQAQENAFEYTFKEDFYSYLKQHPETATHFNEWMKETTREWLLPVLEAYDFSGVNTLVDVGGGIGTLTAVILKGNPQMQAVLFDRPDVVVDADRTLEASGVADRCQIVGGSFFEGVPSQGNLYLLSRVLLNWDDAQAIQILKNCHRSMAPQDKLLIVDFIFPQYQTSPFIGMGSLNVFLLSGHFLRTEDELYHLLSVAGFKVVNRAETKGPVSAIEATPI